MQYDKRFGDAFWNSSKMGMVQHIFDLLTSWALVAEVWYLPPMHRNVSLYRIYATHTSVCVDVALNGKKFNMKFIAMNICMDILL